MLRETRKVFKSDQLKCYKNEKVSFLYTFYLAFVVYSVVNVTIHFTLWLHFLLNGYKLSVI